MADEIRKIVGWLQLPQDRIYCRSVGEAFVLQWAEVFQSGSKPDVHVQMQMAVNRIQEVWWPMN